MDKKRLTIIDYVDGHHFSEDGTITPTIKSEKIVMNSVKRFQNCIYLLAGLRPATRNLMDFLSEEMNEENIVYNNKHIRERFANFMTEITKTTEKPIIYTDQTVKDSFSQLTKTGLIKPISKGVFKVNPKYFTKMSDKDRIKDIVAELKFNSQSGQFRILKVSEK